MEKNIDWQGDTLKILNLCRAWISNTHVVYSSGRHGSDYVNKDFLYAHVKLFNRISDMLAAISSVSNPQIVVGASMGGALLANRVAMRFEENQFCGMLSAYAEEETDVRGNRIRVFKREYDRLIAGKKILLVEDICTTGDTIRKLTSAVRKVGGEIVALAGIWNRGGVNFNDLKISRVKFLINISLCSYLAYECPMCRADIPINIEVGRGAEFLAKKA